MTNGNGEPTGTQRLGDKIGGWLETTPPFSWILGADNVIKERTEEVRHWIEVEGIPRMQGGHINWYHELVLALLYIPTGINITHIKNPSDPGENPIKNPSKMLGDTIRQVMESSTTAEITQLMGAIVTDPVLAALEKGLEGAENDPHEAARAFHGTVAAISSVSGLTSTAIEVASAGQIDNAGDALEGLYWNLGLGFLGWQTLAPLLENGLQPPLQRYYNRKYRGARFSAAQMSDLFALGEVTADQVRSILQENGWRDEDIEQWLRLSYRNLSEGDVWDLYHDGVIDKSQTDRRLRALGYDPGDLDLLYKANEEADTKEVKDVLMSTAKNAYRQDLISADDFSRILRDQKRTEEEITLQLALLDMQKAEDRAAFSRSEVRQLYNARTIAEPEAIAYLLKTDLTEDQARLLLESWGHEDAPEPLRINQATIREAYTDGVLTRADAKDKLVSVGYLPEDAELLLATWETEVAPTAPVPGPRGAGALSLSALSQFAAAGLIERVAMAARPELEKFDAPDRERLIELMYLVPTIHGNDLAENTLVEAYRFAIISRDELRTRLENRGLEPEDVAIALEVIDRQIEEAQEGEITGTVRRPSVGSLQLALQRGLIDEGYFKGQLLEMGFNADAVQLYLFNAQYQAPARPQDLPRTTVISLYKDQVVTRSDAQYRLVKLGYTVADAQLLIKAERLLPQDTEIGEAYVQGYIYGEDALTWFTEFGFNSDEIEGFFEQFPPGGPI